MKKNYTLIVKIKHFNELTLLRKFVEQNFHSLTAVRIGFLEHEERDEYHKRILELINRPSGPGSSVVPSIDDEPPMYVTIRFLFEKDMTWFALRYGDKLV